MEGFNLKPHNLFSHYSTFLMSTATRLEKAVWNNAETMVFINYLAAHKLEVGDGANFKTSTFSGALTVLEPFWTAGHEKTVKMCKGHWQLVSNK
jgi:hypothetical protein